MLALKFPITELQQWSLSYQYDKSDLEREIIDIMAPEVKKNGYLTKAQFLKVCRWKTQRSKSRCEKNDKQLIKDVTAIALSHPNEKLRIETLTLLDGVSWPTGSVFLHFFHQDKYPILDFRALWSLGIDNLPSQYDFDFWWRYVLFCRKLSNDTNHDMRVIDRALWAYSFVNQK